jgi:hypothetical protein
MWTVLLIGAIVVPTLGFVGLVSKLAAVRVHVYRNPSSPNSQGAGLKM